MKYIKYYVIYYMIHGIKYGVSIYDVKYEIYKIYIIYYNNLL